MGKILITGFAGFIGFHLTNKFMTHGYDVIGIDNFNDYYDVTLKKSREKLLKKKFLNKSKFYKIDLTSKNKLNNLFSNNKIDYVFHLAAQAGVRNSFINPDDYLNSNINGYNNIIELSRLYGVKRIFLASTSSIYGRKQGLLNENEKNLNPLQIYSLSKLLNEKVSDIYVKNFGLKICCMRFFTVYGPFGRPDMAIFNFTKKIINGEIIKLHNNGKMKRDFTYIDDTVDLIFDIFTNQKKLNNFEVINVGGGSPNTLKSMLRIIESNLKIKAKTKLVNNSKGEAFTTFADISKSKKLFGYSKKTDLKDGIKRFIDWYREFYL